MSLNVVILAAGKGTRMKSDLPKVLHPLAGRPLVWHVVQTAHVLNARRIVVVVGHGAEQVREALADAGVQFALQAEQRGTGHAVLQALDALDAALPTLVLYGDVPLVQAASLRAMLAAAGRDALAVLTAMPADPQGYGRIVRDAAGHVLRIVEQKDATEAERAIGEVNTGIMVLPPGAPQRWLPALRNDNAQREYYLTDVVAMARAEGLTVEAVVAPSAQEVQGVNSKAELAQAERAYQALQAQALLRDGVTLADPARIDIRGALRCGRDVFIDVNCVFEGDVQLGDGVRIGANCVIANARIEAGAVIHPFTHVEGETLGVTVGQGALVGPFARLRPGARLAQEVHIGNFVEVKNSTLGRGAKANHLAYLGDATVGERVNYGAGSITANYDGANKHRTVIEDDVHIGSNCVLVAPVTIGRGGTVGAGSTISKDTPPGELTVARGRQLSIGGWKRPQKKR
jgi:bifunctional UDP-N-acetylglucosamine pyrophosphorylase/glucosamine-1-phosphate N-acetyltransferase